VPPYARTHEFTLTVPLGATESPWVTKTQMANALNVGIITPAALDAGNTHIEVSNDDETIKGLLMGGPGGAPANDDQVLLEASQAKSIPFLLAFGKWRIKNPIAAVAARTFVVSIQTP
jgi:hypothetical protein